MEIALASMCAPKVAYKFFNLEIVPFKNRNNLINEYLRVDVVVKRWLIGKSLNTESKHQQSEVVPGGGASDAQVSTFMSKIA